MRILSPATSRTAAGLILCAAIVVTSCEVERDHPEAATAEDLPTLMMFMQRYAEKLHMAGEAGNWQLAGFYAHELEETGEALRDGGFTAHGVHLDQLADTYFLPAVREVDRAIDVDPQAFRAAFSRLVASCNTCHQATGYEFVRIVVPEEVRPFPSQQFGR